LKGFGIPAMELCGAFFCLYCYKTIEIGKEIESKEIAYLAQMMMVNCIVLLCDMFANVYDGEPGYVAYCVVSMANFGSYLFMYILSYIPISYISALVQERGGQVKSYIGTIMLILCLFSVGNLIYNTVNHHIYFIDSDNIYRRGPLYAWNMFPAFISLIFIFTLIVKYRQYLSKKQLFSFACYIAIPVVMGVLSAFSKETTSVLSMGITFSLVMMFITYEQERTERMVKQAVDLEEEEKENMKFKTMMLWTQVQPHFIYNNLNVIGFLCKKDPDLAAETVEHLSSFLRSYIDAYDKDVCIPVEEEIEIINHYVYMQKLRYGEKLKVDINIETTNFMLPPLSLETLVENAIKHGVMKKISGGIVSIHIYETYDEYISEVSDNGVGFDPAEVYSDGWNHVGLKNSISRLKYMINGTMTIDSAVGQGCKVAIHIPKGK